MNKGFLISLLLLFSCPSWAGDLVQVDGQESSEFQESAFIKLMNNFNNGTIPFPFSNLLDSFKIGVRENGNILFVPRGRSLVKEFADYQNPRIIVNPIAPSELREEPNDIRLNREKIKALGISQGDIFIGYAPNHNALEVISFNPKKGAFDFFVVENYEQGKTPKIVNNPALCLSCHQNKAPIFSRFPWSESLGDTAKDIVRNGSLEKNKNNQMMDLIRQANLGKPEIQGINLTPISKNRFNTRFSESDVFSFDISVRQANDNLLSLKACESLCNKLDIACQQKIIELLIDNKTSLQEGHSFADLDNKLSQIDLKSSVIPNRDPYTNTGFKVTTSNSNIYSLKETYGNLTEYDLTFNEIGSFAGNKDFDEMKNPILDSSFVDPASPRVENSKLLRFQNEVKNASTLKKKIILTAQKCLGNEFELDEAFNLDGFSAKKIDLSEKKLILQRPNVLKALNQWPISRDFLKAIREEAKIKLQIKDELVNCHNKPSDVIMPIYKYGSVEKVIDKFNEKEIKKPSALFNKYCIECHGGDSTFIRLPLSSMDDMANYKPTFSDKGPLERLEKRMMPPSFSIKQPTDDERQEMIKVLKDLKHF